MGVLDVLIAVEEDSGLLGHYDVFLHCLNLKRMALWSVERPIRTCQTTRRNIQEELSLQNVLSLYYFAYAL